MYVILTLLTDETKKKNSTKSTTKKTVIRKAIGAGYNVGLRFSVKDLQCALAKTAGFDGSWVGFNPILE